MKRFAAAIGAACALLASSPVAFAQNVPCNGVPGCTCLHWNQAGYCTEYSYFDYATNNQNTHYYGYYDRPSTPSYPSYPSYPSTPSYPYYPVNQNVACNNPGVDCYGSVTVRVTGVPTSVTRGDQITYSLYVRNDDRQARVVTVRAYLDNQTSFVSASNNGINDGSTVRWDTISISANSSRTLTLRVRVLNNVFSTSSVSLRAQVNRSTDSATTQLYSLNNRDIRYYDYNDYPYVYGNTYTRPSRRVLNSPTYYTNSNGYYSGTNYYNTSRYTNTDYYYYGYNGNYYSSNYGNGYYYDSNGNLHLNYGNGYTNGGYSYCDPDKFVCR